MSTFFWILLIVIGFLAGTILGVYLARKQFEKQIAEHPVLTPEVLATMMRQMGQKPSEAKIQQTYRQLVKQSKAAQAGAKK